MKFSKLYCPTLKESPREAEVISHQLMLRAGMIRQVASGIYVLLPLGQKVINKFQNIVRHHINLVGGQEITMPMVIPGELWKETGRWDKYGKELLRFKDRKDQDYCLGPTHEEVVTNLVKNELKSYKQLPVILYQIQTKFRDEIRPRFGVMRGREFSMKDAYSFHSDEQSLDETYKDMINAYHAIFNDCGLESLMVQADSGMIGGSDSAEFMISASTGEDLILSCGSCGYSKNVELGDDDTCPDCSGKLTQKRGIEVGHIFKLKTLYSEMMKATFLDDKGQIKPFMMGCYGIGIARTVAASIERYSDEKGMRWPLKLAPFEVDIILASTKDESIMKAGESLYRDLLDQNVDVLLDDRKDSIGVKFKDAELIGFPYQIVVGKMFTKDGNVECVDRMTGEKEIISMSSIRDYILKKVGK